MLSVLQGQQVAADAGFATPSEEVQQSELMEVLKKWLILSSVGILDAIEKCATLVVDVTKDEFDSDKADETRDTLARWWCSSISGYWRCRKPISSTRSVPWRAMACGAALAASSARKLMARQITAADAPRVHRGNVVGRVAGWLRDNL
mgnify:CR=1 FL=1